MTSPLLIGLLCASLAPAPSTPAVLNQPFTAGQGARENERFIGVAVQGVLEIVSERAAQRGDSPGGSTATALLTHARRLIEQHDLQAAVADLERALAIARDIRDTQLLRQVGLLYDQLASAHSTEGRYEKAASIYQQALAVEREAADRRSEAQTLDHLGFCSLMLDHYDQVITWSEQSLPLHREEHDRDGMVRSLNYLGNARHRLGQDEEAVRSYQEALALERELKDRAGEARTLSDLGTAYQGLKKNQETTAAYQQSATIFRELKDPASEGRVLSNLGYAYSFTRRYPEAIGAFEQSLALSRQLNDRAGMASSLNMLGHDHHRLGQHEEAVRDYQEALAIERDLKDRAHEAGTLNDLGSAFEALKKDQDAIEAYRQSATIYRELKDQANEGRLLSSLGNLYITLRRSDEGIAALEQSLTIRRQLKDRDDERLTLAFLASAYSGVGRYQDAVNCYGRQVAIYRELKDRAHEAYTLIDRGSAYEKLHQYENAILDYLQALAIRRETGERGPEAMTLMFLGSAYDHLAEHDKAVAAYGQALAIRRDLNDRSGEAWALRRLADVHAGLKEYPKAIELEEQALAIAREIKDREEEGYALFDLERSFGGLNQNDKAIATLEQALSLARETKDRHDEGTALNELGLAYARMGRYDKELDCFEQALAVAREAKDRLGEGRALFTMGIFYAQLAQPATAAGYFEQVLSVASEVKNATLEAGTLDTLGLVLEQQGQHEQALRRFESALEAGRDLKSQQVQILALLGSGRVYEALGRQDQAIAAYTQALSLARDINDRSLEGILLNNFGTVFVALHQDDKARTYLERGLALAREVENREVEAGILANLMQLWSRAHQPRLAILLGKESINIVQGLRAQMAGLDQTLQQAYVQARKSAYRDLADVLAGQGRLAEAQRVLDLQKDNEFSVFVQRDRNVVPSRGEVALTDEESRWEQRYREVSGRLTSLGVRRGVLLAKADRSPTEEKELAAIENDLESGNHAFEVFLATIDATGGKDAAAQSARVRDAEGLMETLRALGPGTVAVYTVMGEDGFRSILVTPDVEKGYSTPIPAAQLSKKILAFRQLVRNPESDPRPVAKEIYDILVKPMEADLEGAQARTIMWSLDGALRYLPVAALFDGQRYMVERYRNVVFTPASQSRLKDAAPTAWRGLGLGVSQAHGDFPALPNVPGELRAIIRTTPQSTSGVLPGTMDLDAAFTKDVFRSELRKRYTVVHLASHFDFEPGTDRNSFLLLGDGSKLTLEEFRAMPQVLEGVDLLTLSACDTAVGGEDADGKEVEGFAVLAQRQGAKAVIATLWAVADESTELLMREFYRRLTSDPHMTKAEALRQAQLALLTGTLHGSASADRGVRVAGSSRVVIDPEHPYAHPYLWAPFVLMGNWK